MTTQFATKYGYFSADGTEYVITRPDTPRPWVNVICPGDYGLVVSQTGSGYSWRTHASLNRINRWEQDLIRDEWGKYLYVKDLDGGEIWSLGWKPVCAKPERYTCRHGLGYTVIESVYHRIAGALTLFVPPGETLELWRIVLTNESDRPRRLAVFSYLEWCLGAAPDWHREFHKTFIETAYHPDWQALTATKTMWDIPARQVTSHWNRDWPYVAFHSCTRPPTGVEGSKEAFLGNYRSLMRPLAVERGGCEGRTGRWEDAIACLHLEFTLAPGQCEEFAFILGVEENLEAVQALVTKYHTMAAVDAALAQTKLFWQELLAPLKIETPDPAMNLLTNIWYKYQAVSGRLWGRTAYFQTGGAFGFRDQLQDSQVFLYLDPKRTKEQIRLHARHQQADGTVLHWWHPLAEEGLPSRYSDDLLWLPFITVNYLRETADFSILDESHPFYDQGIDSLYGHCLRAIEHALAQRSERGLPLMGAGDWNDGLNAVGCRGQGESVWVAMFLVGILRDFALVAERRGEIERAVRYRQEADRLVEVVNALAWDGEWYWRATTDAAQIIGSRRCRYGQIFLNPQVWSVIHRVAPPDRAAQVMEAVERLLAFDYGPILLYPGYQRPDPEVGYLTRYAPGVRENAGLYTHAATWAVWAECVLGRGERAYDMYRRMCPVYRGLDPDKYTVEPYVTPGNVDGPESPYYGRGGWTWYTGSAAWMLHVGVYAILGIQPEFDGLRIAPCIPSTWDGFTVTRVFRGATYRIVVENPEHVSTGVISQTVDGESLPDDALVPTFADGREHRIIVRMGHT